MVLMMIWESKNTKGSKYRGLCQKTVCQRTVCQMTVCQMTVCQKGTMPKDSMPKRDYAKWQYAKRQYAKWLYAKRQYAKRQYAKKAVCQMTVCQKAVCQMTVCQNTGEPGKHTKEGVFHTVSTKNYNAFVSNCGVTNEGIVKQKILRAIARISKKIKEQKLVESLRKSRKGTSWNFTTL